MLKLTQSVLNSWSIPEVPLSPGYFLKLLLFVAGKFKLPSPYCRLLFVLFGSSVLWFSFWGLSTPSPTTRSGQPASLWHLSCPLFLALIV